MRQVVPGSTTPFRAHVAVASARPPSTKMAWQMHGPFHGVSSLTCSTLRPNKTHGQNSPVQPTVHEKRINGVALYHVNV